MRGEGEGEGEGKKLAIVETGLRGQDRQEERSPDAGDRIAAREQPEVREVGKIR